MAYPGGLDAGIPSRFQSSASVDHVLRGRVKELESKISRLQLVNAALWEVVRDKLGIAEQELEAKMREVDARDGVEDGQVTEVPLKCPACGRVSSSKYWKCLYCGQEFERAVIA